MKEIAIGLIRSDVLFIFIGVLVLFLIMLIVAIRCERQDYNNGICTICGNDLKFSHKDDRGCRGYKCEKCKYTVWVSYNSVDK